MQQIWTNFFDYPYIVLLVFVGYILGGHFISPDLCKFQSPLLHCVADHAHTW